MKNIENLVFELLNSVFHMFIYFEQFVICAEVTIDY